MSRAVPSGLRVWWGFAHLTLGRRRWLLLLLAGLSLVAGFTEASVLFLIVKSAAALAVGDDASLDLPVLGVNSPTQALTIALALVVVLGVLTVVTIIVIAWISARALTVARTRLLRAFLGTTWELQGSEPEGALQDHVVVQAERAANGIVALSNFLTASVNFAVFAVLGLAVDIRAAALCVGGGLLVIAILRPMKLRTRSTAREHVDTSRNLASRIAEMTRLVMEIRVFGVSTPVGDQLESAAQATSVPYRRARFLVQFLPKFYQNAALALIIGVVLVIASTGTIDATSVGAAVILLIRALAYAQQVQSSTQWMTELGPNALDLCAKIHAYENTVPRFGTSALPCVEVLGLSQATYVYPDGTVGIDRVSLRITSGEVLGVVGPSGSGKSTLVQILLGLLQPTSGTYTVNSCPAVEFDRQAWCREFAFVPQDQRLLRGTISDNVVFARSGVDPLAVTEAITKAQLQKEIEALPEGLGTDIGIGARSMSGGEEQRLGIARALLTSPSVLVLDEPTSSLDAANEERFIAELERRQPGTTVIIVTHRPTSLVACDRIIELRGGRITSPASAAS